MIEKEIKAGTKVVHKDFGEGVIISKFGNYYGVDFGEFKTLLVESEFEVKESR
jgi:hypothetical protein